MGWLSNLFGSSSSSSRRGQALSSTNDAFSLPTSSPTFPRHPDAFNPETLASPGPDSAMSPSYSYPPQGSYGYIPTSTGRSQRNSLLPLHNDPSQRSGPSDYPSPANTWTRLRLWLDREYPELGDTLNYGILPEDLAQIEMSFGFALPAAVRDSYLCVDGQEAESSAGCSEGLFFGLALLPLEDVLDEWRLWREVDDEPTTGANESLREAMQSIPPNWVRREYSQRGWIPLITDKAGNYIGVDLNPAEGGHPGQVIVFGRDFDTKVVLWRGDGVGGWAKWLASFVEELENGDTYEIGSGGDSEGSEDDIGYESYFHDGTGRGQGDGGGDSSSKGGLNLIGEYRGWSTMEAWADRSVRRWYEAGVISDIDLQQEKTPIEKIDIALTVADSKGVEVPIPVLADVSDPDSITEPSSTSHTPRPVPTISITKPPAPLPVDLPTPHEIQSLPSPPESINLSYTDDLESGRAHGMREVEHEQGASLVSTRLPTPPPTSNLETEEFNTSPPPPAPSEQNQEAPDLLVDTSLELSTVPLVPASPQSRESEVTLPAADSDEESSPSSATTVTETHDAPIDVEKLADNTVEDEADISFTPDTTIRLVGSGGVSGVLGEDEQESEAREVEPEPAARPSSDKDETASISSVTSTSSTTAKGHKKTKSGLAGLKKLGMIGLRKMDSKTSIKEITASK